MRGDVAKRQRGPPLLAEPFFKRVSLNKYSALLLCAYNPYGGGALLFDWEFRYYLCVVFLDGQSVVGCDACLSVYISVDHSELRQPILVVVADMLEYCYRISYGYFLVAVGVAADDILGNESCDCCCGRS